MFRASYFQTYDFVINAITDRFDQPDYKMYVAMENIVIQSMNGKDITGEIDKVIFQDGKSFREPYENEIEITKLIHQLKLLPNLLHSA